jgi:hypothetical protein
VRIRANICAHRDMRSKYGLPDHRGLTRGNEPSTPKKIGGRGQPWKLILSAISLLVSIGFGVIGGSIAADPDTALIGAFGVLIVGYALASCVLLFRAWRAPSGKWPRLALVLVLSFSAIWIIGSFDYGSMSGLEVAGAIACTLAASLNWLAIRVVVRQPPNMPLQPASGAHALG